MVLSAHVQNQLFGISSSTATTTFDGVASRVIRLPLTQQDKMKPSKRRSGIPWTTSEHDRFLDALEIYPTGPWQAIAEYVGTRTSRQTMTHAQKYRQKIERSHRVNQATIARKRKSEQRQCTKSLTSLLPTSVDTTALESRAINTKEIKIDSTDFNSTARQERIDCSSVTENMLEDLFDDEDIALLLNDLVSIMPITDEVFTNGPMYSSTHEDQANHVDW